MKNKLLLITLISILIVPFVLSAEYSISGTISFSVGGVATPAEGALVELRDINNILIGENQVTTLNDGAYLFILDDTLIPGAPPKIVVATMPNYPEVGEKFKLTNAYAVNNIISLTFDYACPDSDLDTYFADWCGGNDCNDNEALINPAALDNTDDDVDNDCDGEVDSADSDCIIIPVCQDNDGDGYCDFLTRKTVCINKSVIPGDVDCANKEDNNESPDCEPIPERCDGYDNDCDSLVDEDLPIVCNSTVDCGIPRWTSDYYCGHDGNVYRDSISYQCNFPGTCSSSCSSQTTSQLIEQCSARCLNGQCISGNTTSGNTTS